MSLLSSLNSRFNIGTRINAGFAIVLALLLAVAAMGYYGLTSSGSTFDSYALLAKNTTLVLEADRNVVGIRRNVLLYNQSGSEQTLTRLRDLANETKAKLAEMIRTGQSLERREGAQRVIGQVDQYMTNFDVIVKSKPERDRLVESVMNPLGLKLRTALTDVIQGAIAADDMAVAAYAGLAQEQLMQMRLNANRYLFTNDTKAVESAEQNYTGLAAALKKLGETVRNPERQAKVALVVKEAPDYLAALQSVIKIVTERNRIVNDVNAKLAETMATTMTDLKASQLKALDAMKAASDASIASTITFALTAAGIALVLGMMFAWIIGRGITRPINALTTTMDVLAGGNLEAEVPGTGRGDELGLMAKSVLSFKESGLENIRLQSQTAEQERKAIADKAERDRVAAEAKVEADKQAAAERDAATARVMAEFDAAVGGIAKAAMAGDFSQRVALEGKEGVIRNLAEAMNMMCDNIGKVMDDLVVMMSALSEGDLTKRINANYEGTFGTLKDSANTTAIKLSETVSEITASAKEVANAAAEISTSTTDLSQRTEEQAAGLEETSASMEEISATVKKNAENAQQANQLTAGAREVADRGGVVVASTVEAMSRIEDSSNKIADIIGVIDEIARQTNLLALNAAVEAARAGDAGRGFAVVASEVRSLAQRSSQAAKDIKDLITSSSTQVKDGVDLVNRTGTSLNEIVDSIKRVADIVADIATASNEQATGIDQVNKALTQMDEVTQQNSALVEENAATAKTLESQSAAMSDRVAFFRIDQALQRAAQMPSAARPAAKPVKRGGVVGRMQAGLATALKRQPDFEEF